MHRRRRQGLLTTGRDSILVPNMAALQTAARQKPPMQGGLLLAAVIFALCSGLAAVFLPAYFVVSVLLVPAVLAVMLVRPEYAITACIALVCGLIHPALVPRVPLFGGALAAADAVLLMLAIYALFSFAAEAGKIKATPVAGGRLLFGSVGFFFATFAVAVVISLAVWGLPTNHVLGESRDIVYLIVLPIAVVILKPRVRQERFIVSIVILGCLFSVGQILQGVFNLPVFGEKGISALETLGRQTDTTTRAITLGISVIIYALLLTVGAYVFGVIRKPLFFAVAGLLFIGIFLTYGRTTYAAVLLCTAVVVIWLKPKKLPQLGAILIVVVVIGSAAGAFLKPEAATAVFFRMTSIGDEINHGYSARWRFWEVEAMLPHIQQHPFIGIGLGADYKGASGSTERSELNRYMHNAYLYMAGKMGLPALAFFLLMIATIFFIGRSVAKGDADPWARIVGAAGAAMIIRYLFASITEPHFRSDYGVVNIAIAGALVYLSARPATGNLSIAGKATRTGRVFAARHTSRA